MKMWEIIQEARTDQGIDRERVLNTLQEMNDAEFNRFCQTYLHLQQYYDSNNGYMTDSKEIADQHPGWFWKTQRVDPNSSYGSLRQE